MDWRALEGQRIGDQFDLHRLIGQGGFGAVFDADQMVGGKRLRRIAVKVVTRNPDDDGQLHMRRAFRSVGVTANSAHSVAGTLPRIRRFRSSGAA